MLRRLLLFVSITALVAIAVRPQPTVADPPGDLELKAALRDTEVSEAWIYDDIKKGYARAKAHDKPLLVAFR